MSEKISAKITITAGANHVPMKIDWPTVTGNETLEELEQMLHPQMHDWMVRSYPEHKILETIVRLYRVAGNLFLDLNLQIDPTVGPSVIHGLSYSRGDNPQQCIDSTPTGEGYIYEADIWPEVDAV